MCRDAFRDKPRSTLRAIQCNADWHGVKLTRCNDYIERLLPGLPKGLTSSNIPAAVDGALT
jgi:hypothetical protein